MKIKKISQHQNKLLKFKLNQSKTYTKKYYLNNLKLEDIEYRLKKSFYIIFKYHMFKKRILFLGTPIKISPEIQKILKSTKHLLIPQTIWKNGAITNKNSVFKKLPKNKKIHNNKISKFLFKLKQEINLIVLLNESSNPTALNEGFLAKIPIISLNSDLNIQKNKTSYKIPGDYHFFSKKISDNFFYSILKAICYKSKKIQNSASYSFLSKKKKMILKKKAKFKPLYKKFFRLRENIQNRKKILKFKRKKWEIIIKKYKQSLRRYRKVKPKNQNQYLLSKYPNKGTSYKQRYRDNLNITQKLNLYYGFLGKKIIKRQIRNLLKKNSKSRVVLLIESFEKRLDVSLYRIKFCLTIRTAQQLIVHGKVFVNNRQIRTKSYQLKQGDLISIKPELYKLIEDNIRNVEIWPMPPKYFIINYKTMQAIVGDIKHTNFSTLFLFHFKLEKIINKFI